MNPLGFPVKELGADRANSAAKRAREMEKDGSFVDPSRFDGVFPVMRWRSDAGGRSRLLQSTDSLSGSTARTGKKVHELLAETNTSSIRTERPSRSSEWCITLFRSRRLSQRDMFISSRHQICSGSSAAVPAAITALERTI